jgi:hypothetical protein
MTLTLALIIILGSSISTMMALALFPNFMVVLYEISKKIGTAQRMEKRIREREDRELKKRLDEEFDWNND